MPAPALVFALLAPALEPNPMVVISGFAFHPPTLTVRVGDSVTWVNHDSIEHTATSQTGPGTLVPSGVFDSGLLNLSDSFTFTFTDLGAFHYFCEPHGSSMQGVICVEPCVADLSGSSDPNDPAYGQPDGLTDASDFFYFLDLTIFLNLNGLSRNLHPQDVFQHVVGVGALEQVFLDLVFITRVGLEYKPAFIKTIVHSCFLSVGTCLFRR